ncbi:MAG: ABC transporter ATP-binding protein [bacterium]
MLQILGVGKSFEKIKAVADISLNVQSGEFFGLLGPNGAGKTTLMNIIIGYLKADTGTVSLGDEVITNVDLEIRKKIGYVPQEISLYQELTAIQNLKIFGQFYGVSKKELKHNIERVLELVKLLDRKNDKIKEFSGGMKRRLNLAASLLHNPTILLCDEPTVGVDPQSRNAIFEMLQSLNREGKTIVYTTHYMEEAERMCSKLAIIDHGKIISEGTLQELLNQLENRETIKIQKNQFVKDRLLQLYELGEVIELDFVYELRPNGNHSTYSKIFTRLEEIGIPDTFIELSRASLEDLFLHLTGRSLRD